MLKVTMSLKIESASGPNLEPYNETCQCIATFNPLSSSYVPTGNYGSTNYEVGASSVISSDIFSLMPAWASEATPYQIIYGRQNDYPSEFIKLIGFSDERSGDHDGKMEQAVMNIFFEVREPSRGGTGDGARPMTTADLDEILAVGKTGRFFIFRRIGSGASHQTNYEGTATIVEMSRT